MANYDYKNECSICGAEAVAILSGLKLDAQGRRLMSDIFVCKSCLPTNKPAPKPKIIIEIDGAEIRIKNGLDTDKP